MPYAEEPNHAVYHDAKTRHRGDRLMDAVTKCVAVLEDALDYFASGLCERFFLDPYCGGFIINKI